MDSVRLKPEQVKTAMYLKLVDDIIRGLKQKLYENKIKKITLDELKAVSLKSVYSLKQMNTKFQEGFFKDEELTALSEMETTLQYEVVSGPYKNKFRWEYTKNLLEYLTKLSEDIANRNGLKKEPFYL